MNRRGFFGALPGAAAGLGLGAGLIPVARPRPVPDDSAGWLVVRDPDGTSKRFRLTWARIKLPPEAGRHEPHVGFVRHHRLGAGWSFEKAIQPPTPRTRQGRR